MPSDQPDAQHRAWTGTCAVAVLASDIASEKSLSQYLSRREKEQLAGMHHHQRRRRWVAGRLAAKYLYLHQMGQAVESYASPEKLVVLQLTPESLNAFSPWLFQKVEVLANPAPQNKYPRLIWCGQASTSYVSLSHHASLSSACIAAKTGIGIDLEEPSPRIDSFYRGNFTPEEMYWVSHTARYTKMSTDWLFTLLWTLKETALKADILHGISIWDFPRLNVHMLTDLDDLLAIYQNQHFGKECLYFQVQLTKQPHRCYSQVALIATHKLILTVMQGVHPSLSDERPHASDRFAPGDGNLHMGY